MKITLAEGKRLLVSGTPHHYTEAKSESGYIFLSVDLPLETRKKLYKQLGESLGETTTGEVIHTCGFLHGDFEPCPTIPGQVGPVVMYNPAESQADGDPGDEHCITMPDGTCVSKDSRDMHAVAPWNRYNAKGLQVDGDPGDSCP
jgi:hypothetical protein